MCLEPIDGANIPFVEVVYRSRNSKITAAHYFFGVNGSPLIPWCKFMEIPKLPIFDKTRWCVVGRLMQLPWLQHGPVQKKFGVILKLPSDPPDPERHLLEPRTLKVRCQHGRHEGFQQHLGCSVRAWQKSELSKHTNKTHILTNFWSRKCENSSKHAEESGHPSGLNFARKCPWTWHTTCWPRSDGGPPKMVMGKIPCNARKNRAKQRTRQEGLKHVVCARWQKSNFKSSWRCMIILLGYQMCLAWSRRVSSAVCALAALHQKPRTKLPVAITSPGSDTLVIVWWWCST